jgi:hypothetical protein
MVMVEVDLRQPPKGDDQLLRFIQLDFSQSDPALGLEAPSMTWEFGERHYFEPAGQRPGLLAAVYKGHPEDPDNPDMGPNPDFQLLLPAAGSLKIGTFELSMPGTPGDYVLDVLNADDADVNHGAALGFGFGFTPDDPISMWRANSGDLTGDSVVLTVVPEGDAALTTSAPACDATVSRFQNNVFRLTFGGDVPAPGAGELVINELLDDGEFGDDLSASFTFVVEGESILRIAESGDVLDNERWYAVRNTGGWAGVAAFEVDLVVVAGDVNGDRFNDFADLITILAGLTGDADDDSPYDVNGDGFVDFADISAAFAFNGSFGTLDTKPGGHTCVP